MQSIAIPVGGLKLTSSPTSNLQNDPAKNEVNPAQVMRLDLASDVLEDLWKGVAHGGKGVYITFGRCPTLHYGNNKSKQLLTTAIHSPSELYTCFEDKTDELALSGLLSHKLAMKKAQDNLASTDTALAMLQSSIASHEKDKQSKQIKFVPDATDLPPPVRDKHVAKPLVRKQKSTGRFAGTTTRSMPSSPAVGASRSPAVTGLTSAPIVCDEKTQKLQALRTPLIHLLAVRQVSVNFLSQKTCCSQDECSEVLQKVGQQTVLDPTKWNLNDKSYKELDVWGFPYPSEIDRQFAIDRAVSAFDRMRISREENLWQMLLPKSERGKGKILSKLNLHSGSFQKGSTPRINVQTTDDSNQGEHETGNESDKKDRLAPNNAQPMARSKSHDQITKKKVSEREAQSKRLLAKPKRATPVQKPKEVQPAVKKETKKAAAAAPSHPKSSEYVHDSDEDEDEDMMNVDTKSAQPKTPTKELKKAPSADAVKPSSSSSKARIPEAKSRNQKKTTGPLSKQGSKPLALNMSNSKARNRLSDSSQSYGASSTSSTPLASQQRNTNGISLPVNVRPAPQAALKSTEISHKRKADQIDSGLHNSPGPLMNGQNTSAKRHKASILSPPPSDSSSTATSSRSNSPPSIRSVTIDKALYFKKCWAIYEKLHRTLAASGNPSEADLDNLLRMHERLVTLKDEIAREVHMETRNMVAG